jgi:hypothetical protein
MRCDHPVHDQQWRLALVFARKPALLKQLGQPCAIVA